MRLPNAIVSYTAIITLLAACNREPQAEHKTKPDTVFAPAATSVSAVVDTTSNVIQIEALPDAEKTYVDSMMALEVTLPPILDEKAYDTATVNSFTRMAELTKGEMKLLARADLLEKNITDILCKSTTDYADVVFMIDVTGSMGDDIAEVKEGMNQIIDVLREKRGVRLALATYRDLAA